MRNSSSGPFRRPSLTRAGTAVAAVAALALGLSACGGSDDDSDSNSSGKSVDITITTFGEFGYGDLIKQWNTEHPEIQVTERKISKWDDWKPQLVQGIQSGTGLPDIAAIEGDMMPAIVAQPAAWNDLSDSALDGRWLQFKVDAATTSDGKLLGYATDAGPEAVCYRSDLFAKAGLPSDRDSVKGLLDTWDHFWATGATLTKALPNTKFYDSSGAVAQMLLNQVENPFEKSDGTIDVSPSKAVYDAVTSHEDLSTKAEQWTDDWKANFKNDGFAVIGCPGWMRSNIKDNAQGVTGWDIADVFPGGGGNWGGSFLGVPKQSKHAKEAQEVAAWLTAPEQQLKTGNTPSQNEALQSPDFTGATEDAFFNNAPSGQIYANRAAAITVSSFHGPHYSDILNLFQQAILRVDKGQASAADSWKTFEDAVKQLS